MELFTLLWWESMNGIYWKIIFSRSLMFLPIFWKKWLSSRIYFQGYLYSKQLWKLETVSPVGIKGRFVYSLAWGSISPSEQWADVLTVQYKTFRSPSLGFFSWCVEVSLDALCITPWEVRLGEWVKKWHFWGWHGGSHL